MKKVGILTFHDADNLGAVLQAYALQKVISSYFNIECEIINYKCKKITYTYSLTHASNFFKKIAMKSYYCLKRVQFNKFRKKDLIISKEVYYSFEENDLSQKYNLIFFGSDQIWNLSCTNSDYTYFADFIDKKNISCCSYAASIGNYIFSNEEKNKVKALLNDFDKISIRENDLQTQIHIDKDVSICLDPVFLLTDDEWRKIIAKRHIKKKYIFVYLIQEDVNVLKKANEYAIKNDCELIDNKRSLKFILNNSPRDFLSWIYYSEAIFTNSFHGVAFSLIFNKSLQADIELKNGEVNKRIKSILEQFMATHCIIDDKSKISQPDIYGKIEKEKEKSIEFIKNCIYSIEK